MDKKVIFTSDSPAAIGPYSQGMVLGGLVFTSGQLPINPVTGEVPEGVAAQTRQCLENMKAILEAAGSSMDKALKATVFLANFDDFAAMNEVYATYFPENPPCRSAVEVTRMARGALVEIEVIAGL